MSDTKHWPMLKIAPHTLAGATILLLLAAIFGLGGSARADVAALQVLRPITLFCLGLSLILLQRGQVCGYRLVLSILVAAAALPAFQLMPLPPQLWHGLPGRDLVVNIDQAAGLNPLWRSLSFSPAATLNVLGASLVPLAVVLLAIQLPPRWRTSLVALPLVFGALGAFLGMLQILGDGRAGLYLFDITNRGAAVGLFANRNHQAVALACLIPLGAATLYLIWPRAWSRGARLAAGLLGLAALVPLILVTGSRVGVIVTGLALASLVIIVPRSSIGGSAMLRPHFGLAISSVVLVIITALAVWQGRDLALDRLLGSDPADELRVQLLPTLWQMLADHGVWGVGMGAFEQVYQIYEPDHLFAPAYVNHAHNDWIELVITGGLPALFMVLIGAVGIAWRAGALWRFEYPDYAQPLRWAAFTCIGLIGLASISDYPLRTPYFAGFFALCLVWFFMPACDNEATYCREDESN